MDDINIGTNLETEKEDGDFTFPTPEIKEIVEGFSKNEVEAVAQSMQWIESNIREIPTDPVKFRKRDALEIINSKEATGCTDRALVFLSFMRGMNIPATFLEGVSKEVVERLKSSNEIDSNFEMNGHVFVRVGMGKQSIIVDPTFGQISMNERYPLYKDKYLVIGEGRDFNDIGTSSEKDILDKTKEYIRNSKTD